MVVAEGRPVYNFAEQLTIGELAVRRLELHILDLSSGMGWWHGVCVRRATPEEDRRGIDLFLRWNDGATASLQIKIDRKAQYTGNLFVETTSVAERGKLGCVSTCRADFFVFVVEGPWDVYWCETARLRRVLAEHWSTRPTRAVANEGWTTRGIPVRIAEFRERVQPLVSNMIDSEGDDLGGDD